MAATTSAIPAFKPTYLGAGDLPWHPFTPYSEEVMLKILHLDLVRGEVVLMLKAPGGTNLGPASGFPTGAPFRLRSELRRK